MPFFQESKNIKTEYDNQELSEEKEKLIRYLLKTKPDFEKKIDDLIKIYNYVL